MGQEPTVEAPQHRDHSVSEPAHFDNKAEEAADLTANAHADNSPDADTKMLAAVPGNDAHACSNPFVSSVAAALTGNRAVFLHILSRAVDADISPAGRR